MGSSYFKNRKDYIDLVKQKNGIQKCFPHLKVDLRRNILWCHGALKPLDDKEYQIEIKETLHMNPKVWVIKPRIKQNFNIHMYKDRSLCLYYPFHPEAKKYINIAKYIIPWTSEWLIYYELYKEHGVWYGDESKHMVK